MKYYGIKEEIFDRSYDKMEIITEKVELIEDHLNDIYYNRDQFSEFYMAKEVVKGFVAVCILVPRFFVLKKVFDLCY